MRNLLLRALKNQTLHAGTALAKLQNAGSKINQLLKEG
jgi:hypothetical protein